MLDETVKALETGVCELTYFFAFEFAPTLAVEAKVETFQVLAGYEIDEAITYVAVVLHVARQIQEIVCICVLAVDLLSQILNCVFIRNIFDHQCSSLIFFQIRRFYNKVIRIDSVFFLIIIVSELKVC